MKKIVLFALLLSTLISCKIAENNLVACKNYDLKTEMNQSVIDGFFDGDSTNAPKGTYFLK